MGLITKQDLIERTRISAQLSDRQVLPFIQDAETYDLPTLLSGSMIKELRGLDSDHVDYDATVLNTVGQDVLYDGEIYEAIIENTGLIPGVDTEYWRPLPMYTLKKVLLKEFLVWSAYRRLLLEHGRNITEAGLTIPSDPEGTFQQGSDKSRAELIQSATDKANFHRRQIEAYLNKNELVTRNTCDPIRRRGNGRITAL